MINFANNPKFTESLQSNLCLTDVTCEMENVIAHSKSLTADRDSVLLHQLTMVSNASSMSNHSLNNSRNNSLPQSPKTGSIRGSIDTTTGNNDIQLAY